MPRQCRYYSFLGPLRLCAEPSHAHLTPSRDRTRTLVGDAVTSSLRSRASTLCAHSRLPEVADSLIHSSWGRQAPRWDLRYAAISFIPFPGNAFGALIGGEFEGTWLYFCFFTIAGKPKKESPYGQIVTARPGGDYLGELGAARPAERPKFRPDFGLGDPAKCPFTRAVKGKKNHFGKRRI